MRWRYKIRKLRTTIHPTLIPAVDKAYQPIRNQANCLECPGRTAPSEDRTFCQFTTSSCSAGTYVSGEACQPCEQGECHARYNVHALIMIMLAGTFTSGQGQQQCRAHQVCAAGSRESQSPTPSSDRQCQACPAGEYTSAENQRSCTACEGRCSTFGLPSSS